MHITDIIGRAQEKGAPRFGIELLPPLKGEGPGGTFEAISPLMDFDPAFINITYHREDIKYVEKPGGLLEKRIVRRRPGTVGISGAIMKGFGVEVVHHLICGGMSRYDIEDALIDLDFLGINNVLALRGDNMRGEHAFRPHPEGHRYASELVEQITAMNAGLFVDGEVNDAHRSNFCMGIAGYPEKHSEAPNLEQDITNLKIKADAGAHYIVTQMSYDSSKIIEFAGMCRKAGIDIPIIPGIKPISAKSQLTMLPKIFHVDLPQELVKEVSKCKDNAQVREMGAEWAIQQGRELLKAGFPVLHFYTMGKTDNIVKIAKALF